MKTTRYKIQYRFKTATDFKDVNHIPARIQNLDEAYRMLKAYRRDYKTDTDVYAWRLVKVVTTETVVRA